MRDETDKQTVDVFEPVEQPVKKGAGGVRPGAGRPKLAPTVMIRVPVSMVDSIRAMAKGVKAGHSVEYRIVRSDNGEN